MHYAVVSLSLEESDNGPTVELGGNEFAWLTDMYGPDSWEWGCCDELRAGALRGVRYALEHLADQTFSRGTMQPIERNITINAPRPAVWDALTNPDAIPRWMGEPEMGIEVITDWKVGGPILITGFHHVAFRNRGTILRFEPESALRYTHLSSVSGLPDEPSSYTTIGFELAPVADRTSVTLTVENFPDEVIFKHLELYWRVTMEVLRKFIEQRLKPET
jgi:uncharacterized protein YndB with AHSA1/START domain